MKDIPTEIQKYAWEKVTKPFDAVRKRLCGKKDKSKADDADPEQ